MASPDQSYLGTDIVTNGSGAPVKIAKGGYYGLIVRGTTLGGGTLKIQACDIPSEVDADWVDVFTVTAINSYAPASLVLGAKFVRYSLAGATGPSIDAIVIAHG